MKWGCFVKKWKMGGVFCKKVDLSSTQGALCTVSVFFILHFTYLGRCTHSTHPLPTDLLLLYGKSKAGLQSQTNNKKGQDARLA